MTSSKLKYAAALVGATSSPSSLSLSNEISAGETKTAWSKAKKPPVSATGKESKPRSSTVLTDAQKSVEPTKDESNLQPDEAMSVETNKREKPEQKGGESEECKVKSQDNPKASGKEVPKDSNRKDTSTPPSSKPRSRPDGKKEGEKYKGANGNKPNHKNKNKNKTSTNNGTKRYNKSRQQRQGGKHRHNHQHQGKNKVTNGKNKTEKGNHAGGKKNKSKNNKKKNTKNLSLQPLSPVEFEQLKNAVVQQIEYFFSDDELCRNTYLRGNMDVEGYIPAAIIFNFPSVSAYYFNYYDLLAILAEKSRCLDVDQKNETLRRKDDFKKWLCPNSEGGLGCPRWIKELPPVELPDATASIGPETSKDTQQKEGRKADDSSSSGSSSTPDTDSCTDSENLEQTDVVIEVAVA